jgi:hypothetical protein
MENKMTPATCTAWAIKAPDGTTTSVEIADDEETAWKQFAFHRLMSWQRYKSMGYRCVKVRIEEDGADTDRRIADAIKELERRKTLFWHDSELVRGYSEAISLFREGAK